ncbi:MAG: hypothetical protein ABSF12_12945 [Bryobacteraceae bacterium]
MRWAAVFLLALPCVAAADQPAFIASFPNDYYFGITAMKVDTAGNTYLTGYSRLSSVPVTPDAYQSQPTAGSGGTGPLVCAGPSFSIAPIGPCVNGFLIKLDPRGAVVYGTYLGGSATAFGMALALDAAGNVYVCGLAQAPGLPVTPGAAFTTSSVNAVSAFVQKFDPTLQHLIYSTYIPGITYNAAMALDAAGNAYVAGTSVCPDGLECVTPFSAIFPTTPGAFQTSPLNNSSAGVVAALNASGSALIYATYLSGSVFSSQQAQDQVVALAVDAAGDAFIAGFTGAADFPVTAGAFQTKLPNSNAAAFVAKLNPQGNTLLYSTFLGGNSGDYAEAVEVDSEGTAWVLGQTSSTNFPLTPAPFESAPDDHFLVHLSPDGGSLSYSTYFPGVLGGGQALDLNAEGEPYVASSVSAAGLPTGPVPFASNISGGTVYLAKFAASGRLVGASYFGGSSGLSYANLIAAAPNGLVTLVDTADLQSGMVSYVTNLVPWLTIPVRPRR